MEVSLSESDDHGLSRQRISKRDNVFLTSGEAAERVGLNNRGLLLQFLNANCIAPIADPAKNPQRYQEELDERMNDGLKWRRPLR